MKHLRAEQRCKVLVPATSVEGAHQCHFAIKTDGLCGTHARALHIRQLKLGHDLDSRYRIRQLTAGYDELRTVCNRLQAERDALRALIAGIRLMAAAHAAPDATAASICCWLIQIIDGTSAKP